MATLLSHLHHSAGFSAHALKESDHCLVALLSDLARCVREQAVLDARQLDDVFVDRGVIPVIVTLVIQLIGFNRRDRHPEPLPVCPSVCECSCHSEGADGIEFVGVEQYPGLQRGGARLGPKTMGGNGVEDGLRLFRVHPGALRKNVASPNGPEGSVIAPCPLCLLPPDVVQESCASHHRDVSLLHSRDVHGEMEDTQDVVEVVYRIRAFVESSGLGEGDHAGYGLRS